MRAGRSPLFASVSAGATNTGAVDPLDELADVCRRHGVWLHVDAAYGGFAVLADRGREALRGIEAADSIALDPHKWLYQPMECGALLVRDGRLLRRAFEIVPDYLKDAAVEGGEVNFSDLGLQLTRGWRALKVWMSIQTLGLDAFRAAIDRCLDLAALAEERVRASDDLELMSPASLGIVCFRRRFDGVDDEDELAELNAALVARLEATGEALVSSTRLHGRYAIRLCIAQPHLARRGRRVGARLVRGGRAPSCRASDGAGAAGARRDDRRRARSRACGRSTRRRSSASRCSTTSRPSRRRASPPARASVRPRRARRSSSATSSSATSTSSSPARPRCGSAATTSAISAPATSSASLRRSTGVPATATPARPPSRRPSPFASSSYRRASCTTSCARRRRGPPGPGGRP